MTALRVGPTACRAHGLCADLLPAVVDLDEWGCPLPPHLVAAARRATAACLRLVTPT